MSVTQPFIASFYEPTLICLVSRVGKRSSSTSFTAALPLNKSMVMPGGRRPWCCCHFRDWRRRHLHYKVSAFTLACCRAPLSQCGLTCPSSAMRREGGTTLTSPARAWAMAARRFSLLLPSGYAWVSRNTIVIGAVQAAFKTQTHFRHIKEKLQWRIVQQDSVSCDNVKLFNYLVIHFHVIMWYTDLFFFSKLGSNVFPK